MNRRERGILTVGLTIGMLVTLLIAGTGVVSLGGGARAQDATGDSRAINRNQSFILGGRCREAGESGGGDGRQ